MWHRQRAARPLLLPRLAVCLAIYLAMAGVSLDAHPFSVSYARITVNERTVDAIVRLPLDDVDLLLRLDRDLDGRVSPRELEAARGVVAPYLARHLHVSADGSNLTVTAGALTIWRDPSGFEYIEAALQAAPPDGAASGRRLRNVSIHTDFLVELYPAHTTQGRIAFAGRDEGFDFRPGTIYERRVAAEPWTGPVIVLGAGIVLGMLWFARRRTVVLAAAMLLVAGSARADVIMTSAGLNTTLKSMERFTQQAKNGSSPDRAEAAFQTGVQADALATLMNDEVASHGMENRELIDLALSRTKELGIAIAYDRDKKKFFYDGAAFEEYLRQAPRGRHAANAEFTLLAYQFYKSNGDDVQALTAAIEAKKRFLTRYPKFEADAELSLYLAIDYRDLYLLYTDAHDAVSAEKYRRLTRAEYLRIARQYAGTEQADSARRLLQRFDEQTKKN